MNFFRNSVVFIPQLSGHTWIATKSIAGFLWFSKKSLREIENKRSRHHHLSKDQATVLLELDTSNINKHAYAGQTIIIINMLMPVHHNSLIHLRVLLVLKVGLRH
jgi:hypothetical protein